MKLGVLFSYFIRASFPLYLIYVLFAEQIPNPFEPALAYMPLLLVETIFVFLALVFASPVRLAVDGKSFVKVEPGGGRKRDLLVYSIVTMLVPLVAMSLVGFAREWLILFALVIYNFSIELFTPKAVTAPLFALARMFLLVLLGGAFYVLYEQLSFSAVSSWVFILSGLCIYYTVLLFCAPRRGRKD